MSSVFKWGVLGPGWVARKFAEGLRVLENVEIAAVASRSQERANAFADEFRVARTYGTYADLANDPDINAVYVATPHVFHCEQSIMCLKAGKAVLCEKPFTVNAWQAAKVIEVARASGVFLMEAMWTRFLPIYTVVHEWLKEGIIGDVLMLKSDFGSRTMPGPEDRRLNLQLAGGALLDKGVYSLALASTIFHGPPKRIESMSHIGATGIDEESAVLLGYDGGQLGIISCTQSTLYPQDAWICGSKGNIHIPNFWRATRATFSLIEGTQRTADRPFAGTGYQLEAAEVMQCVRQGKLESEVMPLGESLEIVQTMDRIRVQWGLVYPIEGESVHEIGQNGGN